MYEAKFVYAIDGEGRLRDIELRALFAEGVLLHEERHHVSAGQELHDEVEVHGVLETIVHLDDPLVVGFDEDIAFCTDVCYLWGSEEVD